MAPTKKLEEVSPEQICSSLFENALKEAVEKSGRPEIAEQRLVDLALNSMVRRLGPLSALEWLKVAVAGVLATGAISPADLELLAVAIIGAANGGPEGIRSALNRLTKRERNRQGAPRPKTIN